MGQINNKKIKKSHRGCVKKEGGNYERQNKKTGKVTTARLCHPVKEWSVAQQMHRQNFKLLSSTVSQWLKDLKVSSPNDYQRLETKLRRQGKCKTVRNMILSNHAKVTAEGEVVINVLNLKFRSQTPNN